MGRRAAGGWRRWALGMVGVLGADGAWAAPGDPVAPGAPAAPVQADAPSSGGAAPVDPAEHLVDYALVGVGAATLVVARQLGSAPAAFGPVYDPRRPERILDRRHASAIGAPFSEESVPTAAMGGVVAGGWLAAAALGALALPGPEEGLSLAGLHHGAVGYAEALTLTLAVVEVSKRAFGRLRPDFQDRARAWHCNPAAPVRLSADQCAGVTPGDLGQLEDGQRSFISGHSSAAFATATYLSLQIGGRFVWGREANATTRWFGVAAQVALMGAAHWVAYGRVDEHRHHLSDAAVGGAVGFALANLGYWRFYDLDGQRRGASAAGLRLAPTGLGLGGTF